MLRPRRFTREIDPGPVQIHARKVEFAVDDVPLEWIPGHPVASNMVCLLNAILPVAERWFVATFSEALPLVKDPQLAEDMRGFIGQEAVHAETHDRMLKEWMGANGVDPQPILAQVEHLFEKTLGPSNSRKPNRRMNQLSERLWLIAAIEHYTALLGDFALNNAWDDFDANPTIVDLFRWHGSEEVEHRCVAHDVAVYFNDSYLARFRAMVVAATAMFTYFERGTWYLCRKDPALAGITWRQMQRLRRQDSALRLLPNYRQLYGSNTLQYFRPGFYPDQLGSTAQAVAYLASSPAARAATQ